MLNQAIIHIAIPVYFQYILAPTARILKKAFQLPEAELNKLRTVRLGTIQLSKAKNQIKGYLARGYENHESLMLSLGKSLLVFNKIDSIEDICRKIDNISSC